MELCTNERERERRGMEIREREQGLEMDIIFNDGVRVQAAGGIY